MLKNDMVWIKTISFEEADEKLKKILLEMRATFPAEYETPAPKASPTGESIVSSHTLIPEALYHAFSTFGSLMSADLPLQRRHHEMIATMVSVINRCHY